MGFIEGDRVRVVQSEHAYTGCRGVIVDASGAECDGQLPLGYYVAIDGENGVARPFLTSALEKIVAVSSRSRAGADHRVGVKEPGGPPSR